MRSFTDPEGAAWDVVLGRESWGALYALFVPVSHTAQVRQALLPATGYDTAHAELDRLSDEELAELFRRATVKET
jgi:hypothetical protein